MTVKEEAPQVYKPRKGKVNGNMDKFTDVQLQTCSLIAGKMLKNLGYYSIVTAKTENEA